MKAKDLAKLLGVSASTVSVVLNNKPGISDSLRASLEEKIRELGYGYMLTSPGSAVRSGGNSQPVIAYLSYIDYECEPDDVAFFPGVINGAETEARRKGCGLVVLNMQCEGSSLPELLRQTRGNVIGAILETHKITEKILADTASVDVPCVFMDSFDPSLPVSSVNVDNRQSMAQIVGLLYEHGHRKIGSVFGDYWASYVMDRHFCYRRALAERGLEYRQEFDLVFPRDTGRFQELFSREDHPTALVTQGDGFAVWAINALRDMGLRVPEDVSVVGFDNTRICTMVRPNLTSVRNSSQLMGRSCVQLLFVLNELRAEGEEHPQLKISLPTQLVQRDSVGPVKE